MKPILRSLLICEETIIAPSLAQGGHSKILLVQPLLNLGVPFLPTQLSFSMYAGLSDFDANAKPTCTIQIVGPNGEVLHEHEWPLEDERTAQEGVPATSAFASNIKNLIVHHEGAYKLVIIYNNEPLGEYRFDIIKVEQR